MNKIRILNNKMMDILLIIGAVICFVYSYYSPVGRISQYVGLSPALMPRTILILLIFFCLVSTIFYWKVTDLDTKLFLSIKQLPSFLLFIGSSVVFIFVVRSIGLFVSILAFIIFWMYYFGLRKWITLLIISILGTVGIYYLFITAGIYIPRNVLFF